MKMKKIFLLLYIFCTYSFFAQIKEKNWISIDSLNNTFIDSSNIIISGNEIYVWTLEKNNPPLEIESIDKKVSKTKTYYLINKELKRYSIMQVIYYDNADNVLKSYSYEIKNNLPYYRYSTP
ncbi:MAG: hypothetical protein N3B14_09985, partial [Thermoleophilia bacterium]|nr:hypothetical protein [Thermoleophilia bacterium]